MGEKETTFVYSKAPMESGTSRAAKATIFFNGGHAAESRKEEARTSRKQVLLGLTYVRR